MTTALALQRAGIEALVVEQAPELREVGAGLQLAPNATRILERLGLGARLAAVGVTPAVIELRRWDDGRVLLRQPLGLDCTERYGAPYYHISRPDLLAALAAALPPKQLALDRRCVAVAQNEDEVEVTFQDGSVLRADVLIGADGIHSAVRGALFQKDSPRFSGYIAYRGMVPAERLVDLDLPIDLNNFLGPHRHFVRYFVGRGSHVNFVAIVPARDEHGESWSAQGDVAEAVAEFAGWHPSVQRIIGAADSVFRLALHDRDPLPNWSVGRVTLVGDAAHPMLPFLAQGASQAVEDATVLARCLTKATSGVADALRRYEETRQPRVNRIQAKARENAVTYHLVDGDAQRARDDEYAAAGPAPRSWLFKYDADA